MVSIAAQEVAKEVLETIGKGKKVNLGKIARKKGYTQNTSDNPKQITESKSYKQITEPVVKQMEKERQRLMDAISIKDLNKLAYEKAVDAIDKLTKNIQLLSGKETEIIKKYSWGDYESSDNLQTETVDETPTRK